MSVEAPGSVDELLAQLRAIFPTFELADIEQPQWWEAPSYHSVMAEFLPYFAQHGQAASNRQLKNLSQLLVASMSKVGALENAVDTCFMEHLHQVSANLQIRRFLVEAQRETLRNV